MADVEFRLHRGYRRRELAQGIVALIVAAGAFAASLQASGLRWAAAIALAYAAVSFAVYGYRGRLRTRLTDRGIEVRGYRIRLVPWQDIAKVETIGYYRVADVPAVSLSRGSRSQSAAGRSPRTLGAVQVTRTSGGRIRLPAPLITSTQDDLDFTDKVQLIRARWQQAVAGTARDPELRASSS